MSFQEIYNLLGCGKTLQIVARLKPPFFLSPFLPTVYEEEAAAAAAVSVGRKANISAYSSVFALLCQHALVIEMKIYTFVLESRCVLLFLFYRKRFPSHSKSRFDWQTAAAKIFFAAHMAELIIACTRSPSKSVPICAKDIPPEANHLSNRFCILLAQCFFFLFARNPYLSKRECGTNNKLESVIYGESLQ
jgi:hypothetical protein